MEPFATVDDVESRWRPLSSAEKDLAEILIDDASDMIRTRWSDIDGRLSGGLVRDATLRRIVAGMVRRGMMNRDVEGVVQAQQTTGPFSDGATFSNPNNNLYLSADDIRALDPIGYGIRVRMAWQI